MTIITDELSPPSLDQLESSLSTILDELMLYRAKQDALPRDPSKPIVGISAKALMDTPSEVLDALDWAEQPIDRALKSAMKELAQIIFDRVGNLDTLSTIADRVCDREPGGFGSRMSALNSALDGVGHDQDRWWS